LDVIDRLVARLLDSDVPLERIPLTMAAAQLLDEEAPLADPSVVGVAVDAIVGLGPLEPLLRDPAVSDVLVNGSGEVWVERAGALERTTVRYPTPDAARAAVERVIAPLGLRLDHASPFVDARLSDGSRLHAVIPPISVDGPVIAVRRFTEAVDRLEALVAAGGVSSAGADLLRNAVVERRNLVVCGGTGSGKTTLLNVLSKEIPPAERVVTVEDAAELRLAGHVVRLEARPPNAEGLGAVAMRDLVRHALRLRPDRIIVGEVRGPEALDMVQALSTGHDGSMSTVHANSPEEAMWRLETLALGAAGGRAHSSVRRQLWAAVDAVVHTERRRGGRVVASIAAVDSGDMREVYACSSPR
jgi:pilus assembly protein CpaF